MAYTSREFGRLALAGLPAAAVVGTSESMFGAFLQAKPNSLINGVQIGTITYSYRSMPDQSAEATLRYVLESGISAIELMGGPIESYAGIPTAETGGGGGRGPGGPGGPEGRGARGWRWTRARRGVGRTAGRAAGTGRQGEGVAHQRLDGPLQEAAQDVQRRRRHHLCDEDAQRQHVGRGVRIRVQRRGSARRESHHARTADRRRGAETG